MGTLPEVYPTKHLLEQMENRAVTWGEIIDVVEKPEVTFGPDHLGRKSVQRGNLCVVVARDGAVLTVLLRQGEQWTNDDAKGRGNAQS